MLQFGARLSELRKDHQQTQQELAEILCVSKFTVSSWEQNKSPPPIEMVLQICDLYDVSSDFLLGRSDYDPPLEQSRQERLFTAEERLKIREYEQFLIFQRKYSGKKAGREQ